MTDKQRIDERVRTILTPRDAEDARSLLTDVALVEDARANLRVLALRSHQRPDVGAVTRALALIDEALCNVLEHVS